MLEKEKRLIKKGLKSLEKNEEIEWTLNFKYTKPPHEISYHEDSKTAESSEKVRLEGNKLFTENNHDSVVHHKILKLYNQSIAHAPINSESLAVAYANKAAILLHICKYRESISEIDRAFKITKSPALKVKLLCRRAKCLTSLGSSDNRKCLSKAAFWLNKFEGEEGDKQNLVDLISKAETFVQGVSQSTLKFYKANAKLSKTISRAEINCDKTVEIVYSQECGRHLIATRRIEPGEILLVEKTLSYLHPKQMYTYCGHCTSFLWEIVPCDSCTDMSFCSEKCKLEAWEQYHDVECTISPLQLLFHDTSSSNPHIVVGLRVFIAAVKQAKSITSLKNSLHSFDDDKGQFIDFSPNGQLIDYKHVYALWSNLQEDKVKCLAPVCAINLFILAKFPTPLTQFLKYHNFNLSKMMNDDDILFLGALMLRFCSISGAHGREAKSKQYDCGYPDDINRCEDASCCKISMAFGVKTSLANYSCVPNTRKCVIDNSRIIQYAIQPIEKGSQIFDSYLSIFSDSPKDLRQIVHRDFRGSDCHCQACEEDWPVMNLLKTPFHGLGNLSPRSHEVLHEIWALYGDVHSHFFVQDTLSNKKILKFSKIVEEMVVDSPLPSKIAALAINCLAGLMDAAYGFHKPQVPYQCGQ